VKKLRVVSYAINGRGMGHLVRQLSILRWVRRICGLLDVRCECWVLTSSEADTLARREGIPALKMPSKAMLRDAGIEPSRFLTIARSWVLNAIAGLQPDLILVDTFPGGSFGELLATLEMVPHRVLVARRVRDSFAEEDGYRSLLPLYEQHIVPDERGTGPILIRDPGELLGRERARQALGIPDDARAVYLSMGGGGEVSAPRALPRMVDRLRERGWHVVVGAGPLYQGAERRGPGITWIDRYVPMELLPGVDAAVSACGYNSYHELMFVGVPTVFLPLPRIADDQAERAQRAEAAGAGRVAATMDEIPDLLERAGSADSCRKLVPKNGARDAAVAALSTVLPAEDLAMVDRVFTPRMLALLARQPNGDGSRKALELLRILAGGTASERAARSALVAELAARGVDVSAVEPESDADDKVQRFAEILEAGAIPFDTGVALLKALHRKFPAASSDDLIASAERLFATWGRFDDWMGAVSLMRAVPTQRELGLDRFSDNMAQWLEREEDLFDALRDFTRLEQSGERSVSEVLTLLSQRGPHRASEVER
jgi:hypothetical protein